MVKKSLIAGALLLCAGTFAADKDLLAHWSFDNDTVEGLKSSVGDLVLSPRSGKDLSKVRFVQGMRGKAVEFLPDNKVHYALPPFKLTDIKPPFTFACWVKKTQEEPKRAIICATASDPFDFGFEFAWMYKMGAFRRGDRSKSIMKGAMTVNKWHHIAVTHDGKEMKLYIDTKLTDTKDASGLTFPEVPKNQSAFRFTVGHYPTTWHAYAFTGMLDDLFVFARALNEEEIGNLSLFGTADGSTEEDDADKKK